VAIRENIIEPSVAGADEAGVRWPVIVLITLLALMGDAFAS